MRDATTNSHKSASSASFPLILDVDDFKGEFSFDALFGNLVSEILPNFKLEEAESEASDSLQNATKYSQGVSSPLFPDVEKLLSLFRDSCKELVELRKQIDGRVYNLKKDVSVQDKKHRRTLGEYLMEFNSSPGDLMEISPLFSDDSRVAEAASIAQKLRSFAEEDIGRQGISAVGNATASRGLEVAVANLQDYCNGVYFVTSINWTLEYKLTLLNKEEFIFFNFPEAILPSILSYVSLLFSSLRYSSPAVGYLFLGTSAMQHYVATRPMFIDVEIMNADTRLVLGDQAEEASPSDVARGLSSLYKEITDTVRKEAATIMAVFPSPSEVMSILVQRVLEQRITSLLDKLLVKPSLVNIPSMKEGGLILYLRILAVAYEKTQELAADLRAVGCGDLDVEGLTESLFSSHKDEYPEYEQASLRQLYKAKMEELQAESHSDSSGTVGRSKGSSITSSQQQISVTVVTEFVRWNEEAISRCILFSSQYALFETFVLQPATLATYVKAVFTCLLDQISQYIADGLERARESLTEAANLREKFVLGTSVGRRATSAAETAAAAGESGFRSFMVAVQRSGSSVAIIQQYFANSISRLLLPVDGAHAACCEEMATAMSSGEAAAYKGLQQCIETVMAEVERLLSAEQKTTDYRLPDDGMLPDHRATNACSRVVTYLSRVLESVFTALEGLNKQAFLTELGMRKAKGNRLHKVLLNHWQKFTFNPSGGLRLKRDITEYGEFVRTFNAPSVDEKFELLGIFIQLRDDYKSAKLASKLSSLWA
ncbi:hypothetical protein RIF29_16609 [Crotalaria pallida]|uniref:Exocyst complex component Sec10-like alpha-helical bundle domain-containing protein n=1 Tax=Crotalaria pallida TaxID=3830 RepID=A0AAN9FLE9_CROPI